jgi:sugar lactone lactonase YvrE
MSSNLTDPQVECVLEARAALGESPVWCSQEKVLYWVDIKRPTINCFDPACGTCRTWPVGEEIGSMGLCQRGGAVIALRSGFAFVNLETGDSTMIHNPIAGTSDMRFNDGRCDRRGRFWAGTLHEKRQEGTAALYRLDPDGTCHKMLDGITVANGLAWSPDNRTMYFADSHVRTIFSFEFDPDTGAIDSRRVFAELPPGAGVPDGATVDREGFLWSANFDGGCITRYAPDGCVDRVIRMPVERPTSCAFGGAELSTLYVTSASSGLGAEQLSHSPFAGGIFALDPGVKGLPEPRFLG